MLGTIDGLHVFPESLMLSPEINNVPDYESPGILLEDRDEARQTVIPSNASVAYTGNIIEL